MRAYHPALAQTVLAHWRAGSDTVEIARGLGISEAHAANIIAADQDRRHAGKRVRRSA